MARRSRQAAVSMPSEEPVSKPTISKIVGLFTIPIKTVDAFKFGNPRKMRSRMSDVLNNSLSEFGYVEPVIVRKVNERFEILNGHHRFEKMKERGESTIEVTVVDCPDDTKAKLLALSLNRVSADWDKTALDAYVDDILNDEISSAFVADVTGFGGAEIAALMASGSEFLSDIEQASSEDEPQTADSDTLPKPKNNPASNAKSTTQPFTVHLTPAQEKIVDEAASLAKARGARTISEAIVAICESYKGHVK